ncbi:NAD-dependent succinate-semialdehyde dehydrogenase [Bacillus litorisediminis]|uniref:NAD-dependent succinate-semialdehyde dehydrogenase n=1 Tax=Bacillus litorisediminis TaxID=2922713 RepID=UPI001FABFFED|nr:NAD-dependent succinate-semialdehyde dehydrogenase [Bacillus litorisediminis]
MKSYGLFINGEWKVTKESITVMNPANDVVVGKVSFGTGDDAKAAVDAAAAAYPEWSSKTAFERSVHLKSWYEAIENEKVQLAKTLTLEQGKPLKEAIGEIDYANSFILWYAEEAKRIYGDIVPPLQKDKRIFVRKQPVGVVAAITPWNFPAAMITRKVGPALAAGCTVVIKPSEFTPLTAYYLAELAEKAGMPKGVINIVTGNPSEIGETWLSDHRVRKITFTGSTKVGKYLMNKSADTVKKVSLELGGHAPYIVLNDADIDHAVDSIIKAKFRNGGQTCVCPNRIYVQSGIVDEFTGRFEKAAASLVVGNGLEDGVDIGPLINDSAVEKVLNHIKDATDKGATLIGDIPSKSENGRFIKPVILKNVTDEMLCMNEETFGPVAPITTFETVEEVITRANDSNYGLAAYIFTTKIDQAFRLSEALEFGIVGVNDPLPSVVQAPFGGMKESGLGREGGYQGIEEFLETQYISFKL